MLHNKDLSDNTHFSTIITKNNKRVKSFEIVYRKQESYVMHEHIKD